MAGFLFGGLIRVRLDMRRVATPHMLAKKAAWKSNLLADFGRESGLTGRSDARRPHRRVGSGVVCCPKASDLDDGGKLQFG